MLSILLNPFCGVGGCESLTVTAAARRALVPRRVAPSPALTRKPEGRADQSMNEAEQSAAEAQTVAAVGLRGQAVSVQQKVAPRPAGDEVVIGCLNMLTRAI